VIRRSHLPTTRTCVLWSAGWFLALQLALAAFLDVRHPEVFDPEFSDRLAVLSRLPPADADRPLLFVIGSSRITTDFRPEVLPPIVAGKAHVVPFNLSHSGSGPLLNLIVADRVFRRGYRPRWAVIEAVPALIGVSGQSTAISLAAGGDLPILSRYVPTWKVGYQFVAERLGACANHRAAICRQLAPWRSAADAYDAYPLEPLGGSTWWCGADAGPEEARRRTAGVHLQYGPGLNQLALHGTPDRAIRELIARCRREGAKPLLLLTPESREFRSWYSPAANRLVNDYYRDLARSCAVPIVDARDWMVDEDFTDGQHLNLPAAVAFTRRLGRDVLTPLVENRFPVPSVPFLIPPQPQPHVMSLLLRLGMVLETGAVVQNPAVVDE
jgi:hypothetical protein